MVVNSTVAVPSLQMAAPITPVLPVIELLRTVSTPKFSMAPPSKSPNPFSKFSRSSVTVAKKSTARIVVVPPPLMTIRSSDGPVIVKSLSRYSSDSRTIVCGPGPAMSKVIESTGAGVGDRLAQRAGAVVVRAGDHRVRRAGGVGKG